MVIKMRVIEVNIIPTYTCNVCNRWFKSKEELNLNFLIICSKKCEFKFIFNLIKKQEYNEEECKKLLRIIGKEQQNNTYNENIAIYEITKYYSKISLSSITYLGSRVKGKVQGSRNGFKGQGSSKTPPIYRGVDPGLDPRIPKSQFLLFDPSFVGGTK